MINKKGLGIRLPLEKGQSGFFDTNYDSLQNEKTKIQNLLWTNVGERPFHPNLGLNLRKYLFEQINVSLKTELETEIRKKIEFWVPNVKILKLNVNISNENTDRNRVQIELDFTLRNKSEIMNYDYETIKFNI